MGWMNTRAGVLVSSEPVEVSISRSIDCRKLGPVPWIFAVFAGPRRVDEGPASELRLESDTVLDDDAPFSATRLVRGLFRGRSGRAGGSASEGEVVADFLFLLGEGWASISLAFSKAFHARISSLDSSSGC